MGRQMGSGFRREGTYASLWLTHVDVWQKSTQYCKAIILQLKKIEKKYWSGLPCSPLGVLPNPGIEPLSLMSPALTGRFLPLEPPGKPLSLWQIALRVNQSLPLSASTYLSLNEEKEGLMEIEGALE